MRRFLTTVISLAAAVAVMVSIAVAYPRVNSVTFATSDGSTTSTTSTQTLSTTSTADTQSLNTTSTTETKSKGSKNEPLCADDCTGLVLTATGTLTGLANLDGTVHLDGYGNQVISCTNNGTHQAPGQNYQIVTSGQAAFDGQLISRNGTMEFVVSTTLPDTSPMPGTEGGCPNDNWTAQLVTIEFTCARIVVTQEEQVTLNEVYIFDPTVACGLS